MLPPARQQRRGREGGRVRDYNGYMERKELRRKAEVDGVIADSMEVRGDIVRRIESREITPEQGQAELRRIKRDAKKNGKVTREQAAKGYRP
jgi:hypothetical protein